MKYVGLVLTLVCGFILAPALLAAPPWTINQAHSRLGFIATWQESEFKGVFKKFDAHLVFDGKDLEHSHFKVTVDVTSADTQSPDRDEAMARPEWFFHANYPRAHFITTNIQALGNNRYLAEGQLTLKGTTRPVTLSFSWRENERVAHMQGKASLKRTDFRIGEGEWSSGEMIGLDVKLSVKLCLSR